MHPTTKYIFAYFIHLRKFSGIIIPHIQELRCSGHVGMATHDVATHSIQVVYLQEGKDWNAGHSPVKWRDVVEETLCVGESEGRESECGRTGRCSGGNTVCGRE